MVPSAFVMLPVFPLTPNGKVDRRALPAPDSSAYVHREYEAPEGAVETAIAEVWREFLSVDRIGRRDNFFELGGHSLLATRVIAHVNHVLDMNFSLRVLFDNPTIGQLGGVVMREIADEVNKDVI